MTPSSQPSSPSETVSPWLGLDIGGANLKGAHTEGWTCSCPFPMWRESQSLAKAIARLIETAPRFEGVAVTMTGELADCFATRAEGVAVILEQITSILPAPLVRVYCVDGQYRTPAAAARDPWLAAASNWHALARWASRWMNHPRGIVIDVGSTTIDIIPVEQDRVATKSKTDSERLRRSELLYTGVERSNLAGLFRSAPLHGKTCPVMNELFATTRDAYLWLGKLAEDPADCNTSDGRPATREASRYRLARLVGEDGSTLADRDITALAKHAFRMQARWLRSAIQRVHRRLERQGTAEGSGYSAIISGHGRFLIQAATKRWDGFAEVIPLEDLLGPELSRSAPAYAVARLAAEGLCDAKTPIVAG